MLIQPLVENAIRHGWQEKHKNFTVKIECGITGDTINIKISDDGEGIDLKKFKTFPPQKHALYNIQQRLQLAYKKNNLCTIDSKLSEGTTVSLKIPG